jgi:hypothetical protein
MGPSDPWTACAESIKMGSGALERRCSRLRSALYIWPKKSKSPRSKGTAALPGSTGGKRASKWGRVYHALWFFEFSGRGSVDMRAERARPGRDFPPCPQPL